MRIGHWQLDSRSGDFEGNLAKVVQGLERADRDHVEIVSFPECFLTGYPDTEELARQGAFATSAATDDSPTIWMRRPARCSPSSSASHPTS